MFRFRNLLKKWQTPVITVFRKELFHKEAILIPVSWKKPRCGWTKLNFDGSCKPDRGSSIGGVFRNHKAEFLLGYAAPIGSGVTSRVAEMVALRRGLELTLEHGWRDLWVEGDAKYLVDMIVQKNKKNNDKLYSSCEEAVKSHLRIINLIMKELNSCVFTHVYREGNRVADKLAKIGHGLDTPELWRHVPPTDQVLHIVNEDAQGKIILRRSRRS